MSADSEPPLPPILNWLLLEAKRAVKIVSERHKGTLTHQPPENVEGVVWFASLYRVEFLASVLQRHERNLAADAGYRVLTPSIALDRRRARDFCARTAAYLRRHKYETASQERCWALLSTYPRFGVACLEELEKRWHILPAVRKFALTGGLQMLDAMKLPRLPEEYLSEICYLFSTRQTFGPAVASLGHRASISRLQLARARWWVEKYSKGSFVTMLPSSDIVCDVLSPGLEEHSTARGKFKGKREIVHGSSAT